MNAEKPLKQYLPIGVETLTVDSAHNFDLFQKSHNSYTLFRSGGAPCSLEELEKLKDSETTTLFVRVEQRTELFEHMRRNLAVALKDPQIPAREKAAMLTETSAAALSCALNEPESEDAIRDVCAQGEHHVTLALMGESERAALRTPPREIPFALSHALSVSNLSILLALSCGVEDTDELNAIGAGALLHELGKIVLDKNYYKKNSGDRNLGHRRLRRYPEIGAKLIERSRVSSGAMTPVLEHQERLDGSGFPFELSGSDISFAGRVVAICDHFDEQTNPTSKEKRARPFEILRLMKADKGKFDLRILYCFIRLLGGVDNPASTSAATPA